MKKSLGILFIILISLTLISATHHLEADYQIIDNSVFVEINLAEANNFQIKLPYDYKTLEVNIDYVIEENLLKITTGEDIKISYITKTFIDKSGSNYYFILKNQLTDDSDIVVYLPEGAILGEIVFPKNYKVSTDGKRIIINWPNLTETEIFISYEFVKENEWIYLSIISILVIGLIIVLYLNNIRTKKKIKEVKQKSKHKKTKKVKEKEITKNLYEEEKQIVNYLLKKKGNEAWTKEIIRDIGISKVKLSRKIRSLEAKEIVKRIPYGNENRIRLIR